MSAEAEPIVADPTDPAWHEARRSFIGASDAAAVLGLSPWATALDVWGLKTGRVDPQPDTLASELGRELEDWIADRWSERSGVHAPRSYAPHSTERHPTLPHIAASVDRIVEGPVYELLECKLVGPNTAWAWADGPPVYVQVQVQVQMAVTGAERVHVCALIVEHGWRWETWPVDRDEEAIATILARLDAWWQRHVVAGERPDPEGDPGRVRESLQRLYPTGDGDAAPVRLSGEATETIAVLRHAKALRRDLDRDIEAAENLLRAALGDATEGFVDDNERPAVTWRPQVRRGHDVAAVIEHRRPLTFSVEELVAAARVLDAVRTETTSRVLRIAPEPRKRKSA